MSSPAQDTAHGEDTGKRIISPLPWWLTYFSIVQILTQDIECATIYPKLYLAATHEVFGLTLVVTWLLTLVCFPEQIKEHPGREIIGSFNPCFGWDYAPASYIALFCCGFNVLWSWRYVWLRMQRAVLLKEPQNTIVARFNQFAALSLGLSSNGWLCLWLIGPHEDTVSGRPTVQHWAAHTGIFMFYCISAFSAYLGNILYIDSGPRQHTVTTKHYVFASIYFFAVFYLLVVYGLSLWFYEPGKEPALGFMGFFTQVADIMWIACLNSVSSFLPDEPPLMVVTKVNLDGFQAGPGDGEENKPLASPGDA